jgi:CBS domain-containing protein
MRDRDAGAVLITDSGGQLIGIFSNRDATRRVLACGRNAAQTYLNEVMTRHPITISPYHTPVEALRLMCGGQFRHLPVIERGVIVGIILRERVGSEDISQIEFEREVPSRL